MILAASEFMGLFESTKEARNDVTTLLYLKFITKQKPASSQVFKSGFH